MWLILVALISVYPQPSLTPGIVDPNVAVKDVCTKGWASKHRNVPLKIKKQVFKRYGIAWSEHSKYEVDHFVSLELGGTNDVENLWPEAYEPRPGAHEKDTVENWLHSQVCKGKMTLQQAQSAIKKDWKIIYEKLHDQGS